MKSAAAIGVENIQPAEEKGMNSQKFKVVVTDYEFVSLEREEEILSKVGAELVAIQCKTEDDLMAVAGDADGLLTQL